MTAKSYKTDYNRLYNPSVPMELWSPEICDSVHDVFMKKGYNVQSWARVDNQKTQRNALIIKRNDVSVVMEVIFRLRVDVEVHIESSFSVAILLLDTVTVSDLRKAIRTMPKRGDD